MGGGGAVCRSVPGEEVSLGVGINCEGCLVFLATLMQMFYCFAEKHSWG